MSHTESVQSTLFGIALLLTAGLLGCSGGGSSLPQSAAFTPKAAVPPEPKRVLGSLAVSIIVPKSRTVAASVRRDYAVRNPKYITAAVQSIVFTQTVSANVTLATPIITTLTVGANCVTNSNAQTCSAVLSGALGQDQWRVDTYASSDGSGTPLSIGVLPFTVVGGSANTATLTLNPAVNSIAFVPASASCNWRYACTTPVVLEALDATGAVIIGPTTFVGTTDTAITLGLSTVGSLTAQASGGAAAATSMTSASAITLGQAVYDGTSSIGVESLAATAGSLSTNFALTLSPQIYIANAGSGYLSSYLGSVASTPSISGLSGPGGVAVDSAGNIYVVNSGAGTLQIYTSTGAVSPIAGGTISGLNYFSSGPESVAVDSAGNIYVANPGGRFVAIYTSSGVRNTSIASGIISSGLDSPWGVAVDRAGNIYIADYNTSSIKIFTSTGAASPIAGGAITAGINGPTGVAVDGAGNIYVANKNANNVKIYTNSTTAGGLASTIAGGTISGLASPWGVAVDSAGNIYVANAGANNIKIYTSTGAPSAIAGGTISGQSSPFGVAVY